jgi:RPA family protein
MKRQHAFRVFASEFNDSMFELKLEGEMAPSFVISPLGGLLNRVFIVGVLTDVENVSEGGDFVRAHVSDPTGVFTIYSGQYQPELTKKLSMIDVPAFVAITGKSRSYTPEDSDNLYVSIRPEQIQEVDVNVRDYWIIETCQRTKGRIEAIKEALKMTDVSSKELRKLGFSHVLSDGIEEALKRYEYVDVDKYVSMIKDALQYVETGSNQLTSDQDKINQDIKDISISESKKEDSKNKDSGFQETEDTVLSVIKSCEGEEGASWDEITDKCEKAGLDNDTIEEALNSLMDKGLIYEPVLGTIKTT